MAAAGLCQVKSSHHGIVMLSIIPGLPFCIGQPVEHPWRRFPANLSVRSQVPHSVSSPFEFGEDLGYENLSVLVRALRLVLLARVVHPEFQLFRHP